MKKFEDYYIIIIILKHPNEINLPYKNIIKYKNKYIFIFAKEYKPIVSKIKLMFKSNIKTINIIKVI